MDGDTDLFKQLDEMQYEIDVKFKIFVQRDLECSLKHFTKIKPLLDKRDTFIAGKQDKGNHLDFWEGAALNCDMGIELFPSNEDEEYDLSWIKNIKIEYLGTLCRSVKIELEDNDYVKNSFLEKRIYLSQQRVDTTKVMWRSKRKYRIFSFFDTDEEDFDVFGILYELYINAITYYVFRGE